jgi:hypothetical protein
MKVHQKRLLDQGKIEKLVAAIRSIDSTNPEVVNHIRTEADYFDRNADRMRYPTFRRRHLFIGSGVIEAGCKTVIPQRKVRGLLGSSASCLIVHFYVAHPVTGGWCVTEVCGWSSS